MRRIEWHKSVESTMLRAAELAEQGCESGTIVGADRQTAGQGRHGHSWHSVDGGLYFTIILRPKLELQSVPVMTLALGVAVADALAMSAGVQCDLRWPNDVMVGDRKLVGILAQWHAGAVLAGVGVNVGQREFPAELRSIATSLAIETGKAPDRDALLGELAASIETHMGILETGGVGEIVRLFTMASSYASGRRVVVALPAGDVAGTTAGLTPDGFLVLRKDNGEEMVITAGGVRPRV